MKKKLGKAIASRLKQLRDNAGISQQEVASSAGLSLSLVAKLEQGKKADPRASTLLALAGALNTSPGRLIDDLFPPRSPKEVDTKTSNGSKEAAVVTATKAKKDKKAKKGKAKKDKAPSNPESNGSSDAS